MLAGGDGRCVRKELQWETLSARRTGAALPFDSPLSRGKHTSGAAFELLHAVVLGDLGLEDAHLFNFCSTFRHKRACRYSSPCPDVLPAPSLVSGTYESPMYTPELKAQALAQLQHMREHEQRRGLRRAASGSNGYHISPPTSVL
uniref:Uncharacterized protein n=1 Tax=Calcidiscus leptoporus TaxID=127549 RepID=A0A7S0JHM6_9EUKA